MAILSIQSRVSSGYVGNAAATPILQRLGYTVWPVDTVALSNHPAHGAFRGGPRPAAEIAALVDGLADRGLLARCDAVLTGYLGMAATGPAVLESAIRVRAAHDGALWICDPVMGDNGTFYVEAGLPDFFRDRALPAADVILPNAFEAEFLSRRSIAGAAEGAEAAAALLAQGPAAVIISGLRHGSGISAVAANADGCWRCMAPVVDAPAHGAGDVFAALFTGDFLKAHDLPGALAIAVAGTHAILEATRAAGGDDLELVAALPRLDTLEPFAVEKIR